MKGGIVSGFDTVWQGDIVRGGSGVAVPVRAAAGTATACHPSDPAPGSGGRTL